MATSLIVSFHVSFAHMLHGPPVLCCYLAKRLCWHLSSIWCYETMWRAPSSAFATGAVAGSFGCGSEEPHSWYKSWSQWSLRSISKCSSHASHHLIRGFGGRPARRNCRIWFAAWRHSRTILLCHCCRYLQFIFRARRRHRRAGRLQWRRDVDFWFAKMIASSCRLIQRMVNR